MKEGSNETPGCEKCSAQQDANGWSNAPAGTICESDNLFCNGTEACNDVGVCVSIHPPTCTGTVSCVPSQCDESIDQCVATVDEGTCFISGFCYNDGDAHPTADCRVCNATQDNLDWSYAQADASCGECEVCNNNGACVVANGHCLINGRCYSQGALNPANACQTCDAGANRTDWTDLTNGESCGACQACGSTGVCTVSDGYCFIDGSCRSDGALNPNNACQICDPTTSRDHWTAEPAWKTCGYCRVCDDDGQCSRDDPNCCNTADADNFEGYCGTGLSSWVETGCRIRYDGNYTDSTTEAVGFSIYICIMAGPNPAWVLVDSDGSGGPCMGCAPYYEDTWAVQDCEITDTLEDTCTVPI